MKRIFGLIALGLALAAFPGNAQAQVSVAVTVGVPHARAHIVVGRRHAHRHVVVIAPRYRRAAIVVQPRVVHRDRYHHRDPHVHAVVVGTCGGGHGCR